jgi:peptide/nickel transport system substrate-binding protein
MRKITPLVAAGAVLALALAACGGGSSSSNPSSSYNAALTGIVNPSTAAGGTVRMADTGEPDNVDPGDTYYAYTWNFDRLYARTLVMFGTTPATATKLVPDMATGLGTPSADLKTWTYHLRPGIKFEDGTPVTSKDVKYAVERSLDSTVFPNGPTYFAQYLDTKGYTSVYKDKTPDKMGLTAIETPNDLTIVFHTAKPFAEFDYFAQLPQTAPVPQAHDTGANYKTHVYSTGPYMFDGNYTQGKSFALKKNPNWSASTDPNRKQLANRFEVQVDASSNDIDNRLLAGTLGVDEEGTGVLPATQAKILTTPKLKQYADSAPTTRLWFTAISASVAPFDNIHCRKAVQYATDKTAMQTAYGGPVAGDIATTMIPPTIPGYKKFDNYPVGADGHGDIAKAKAELALCGKPGGFSTVISARAERPKEVGAALALQQGLEKVGIHTTIKKFPKKDYAALYAGNPTYVKKNGLGILMYGWGVDWNDGFGDLSQIVDSRAIKPGGGNSNFGVVDPKVDALIDKAVTTTDSAARDAIWGQVDQQVMDDAYYIPYLNAKGLYYRPPSLQNVWVNPAYNGQYDYVSLSAK